MSNDQQMDEKEIIALARRTLPRYMWDTDDGKASLVKFARAVSSSRGRTAYRPEGDKVKKIPTMFVRDWEGDRSRVTRSVTPGCEWVLAGEGAATRKLDGTCCMVRDGKLYKRRELRKDDVPPADFEEAGFDEETGKTVGWLPVGDGPEDKFHREAWQNGMPDGTYELLGPKIQGNPEKVSTHRLALHGCIPVDCPRDFDGLATWLAGQDIEGVVFHHPDGRMAKIKKRDFGLKRTDQKG